MAFNGSSNTEIQGDAFNNVHGSQYNIQNVYHPTTGEEILRDLARRAAMNATHDSDLVSALKYRPGTRVQTLETLHEWISDRRSTTRVQWVYGSASVGKSVIARKTAEEHEADLVGAFFFSGNDPTRDKLDAFVATIAYQCCTSFRLRKVVGPLIIDAIRSDPNIFNNTAKVQFRKMLLEPFSLVEGSWQTNAPNLLVIDGIDQCVDHSSQQKLIEIVDYAVSFRTPMPFIWLLCSRFEPQIRHTVDEAGFASFNLNRIEVYNMTVRLTRQLTESDLDIQMYLLEKFAKLRKKRGGVLQDLGETWPSQDDLESLVWRASGQIIFAVTVIKFVDTDDIDYRPQDRLKMILSTEPEAIQASPYPAFDILYRQILSTCRDWDTVRLILRLLITPKYELDEVSRYDHSQVLWNSPSVIAQFLQLGLGDVEMVLLQLRSVIYLPREEDMHPVIRILHTSFTEFLTDKARSGDFFVMRYSREEYNGLVAMLLLRTISSYTAYYPPYHYHSSGQQPSDVAIVGWQAEAKQATDRSTLSWYAFKYWMIYCCRIAHPSTGLFDQLNEFYPESALALALTIPTSNFVSMMLHDWKSCLCWANYNESRAKALQIFIGRMNTLLDPLNGELYIGLSKDCLRHDAIRVVLRAELAYTTPRLGGADILPDIWRYYQTWWTEEHSTVEQRVCPLVLSTHCDRALPEDWVVIRVAPANGRAFNARRPRYTDEKIQWKVFDNDVTHDTSESVEKNIVKEEDLVAFKTRVYELRDLLADLAVPPPDLSPPDPSPPEKPRLESVHEWFRRRGWNG